VNKGKPRPRRVFTVDDLHPDYTLILMADGLYAMRFPASPTLQGFAYATCWLAHPTRRELEAMR
jgi:hypothetical protein